MRPQLLCFIFVVLKVCYCELEDGKGSLVFVFDTTGSMYNDLKQLREGAEMILQTALEEGNVIGDFVFVPFHDPAVGPATVTQDKEVFHNALEKVHVYGGGDCPEKSLGGIKLALEVSKEKSFVYVFTDATAGDHRLVGKVLDGVQRKQSQVVFVLTGHCNDLDKPSFKVYQQIAAASSGQVFNLNKTSVHKVLDFVKSSIKGRMVNLGSSVKPAGSNYTQEIPVDSSLGEVTVSVSGSKPQITVVDPSGEQLTGPPKLITTLDLAEIMVVKVMDPEPGNYSITVGSDEEYSVKVSGLSNLTFDHGFSVERGSLAETSYRPLKGTYNHMMIGLTQDTPVTIDFAEILSLNGSTLFEVPLTKTGRQVYLAEAFIPPDDFFYIAINGKDEHGQLIRRIGTTAVQSKVPDVPYLTTPSKISAYAHSRVVLKCKVESMVPLTAVWIKDSHKLQPQTTSLQTTTIDYIIDDVKEEDVGTYKCFAKNVAGSSKGVTKLSIIVEPPQVSIEPANKTIQIGDNVTITCTVLTEALLLDLQFISASENEGINVEPNVEGIYTFNKTIQKADMKDAGIYTCLATNRGGSTSQSTTISIQSKPTAQILGPHKLSTTLHTIVQITCRVDNSDVLMWTHSNVVVKEITVNGSFTDVLELNVTEDGVWECVAEKGKIKASDTVEVSYTMKPSVRIGQKNITVLNGTVHEVECEVIAIPPPKVVWRRDTDLLNHTITEIKPNLYKSTLTLNSTEENIAATYICYGENSEGMTQDQVQVNVRRKMSVIQGLQDVSQSLYNSVELNCLIDSHPAPQITWSHNGTTLHSKNIELSNNNSNLYIKRLDFDDLGVYSCVADDGYEKIELNATLSVHGLESPTITKEPSEITAVKGNSIIITCRIINGSPKPSITWEFKRSTSERFVSLNKTDSELNVLAIEANEGTYRCVAENVVGRDFYNVELVINYPPRLKSESPTENVTNIKVEGDHKVILTCDVIGIPPPVIFWTKDNLPVTFSKNVHLEEDKLIIQKATEYDSGSYICNAKNTLGNAQRNFSVLVYVKPKISSQVPELDLVEGGLVELPCEVKGSPKPTVFWTHDGSPVTDDTKFIDDFGIRFVANLTDFGNFTCRAENQYGNDSVTYTLYVWVPPSIKGNKEMNIDALVGDDISLQCDAVGFPIPTIQWLYQLNSLTENTTDLSFNDIGNLYIRNASTNHEGTYICVAENIKGIDNKLFHINVNDPPKILEDNYTGPYLATNLDSALTIACEATGKPRPYIVWSKDGVYLHKDSQYIVGKDGTLTIKTPSEDMSGNYTCTATNKFGTVNKTIAVEVYSLPTREQSEPTLSKATVLEHSSPQLDCPVRPSIGDTVQWYKNAELVSAGKLTLQNVTRRSEAVYACVVTNAVGSAYSTVALNIEWPPKFMKNDDNDDTDEENNKIVDLDSDKDEEGNIIEVNAKFIKLRKNADKAMPYLEEAAENSNIGSKSNNTKAINDIKADKETNNDNKQNNETTEVNRNIYKDKTNENKDVATPKSVRNVPGVEKGDTMIDVVKGDDVYLDCQTDAKPAAKIKWLHNSKPLLFEDKPRLRLLNAQPRNSGTYKCIATNAHGSVHRIFQVHVSVPPFISEFDVLDVSLMAGVDATLDCSALGYPQPSIHWTFNNTKWRLQDTSLTTTNTTLTSEGIFRCDAKNKAGGAHIVYRVSVNSPAEVDDIVAYDNGVGVSVGRSYEAALGTHLRIACKASGKPTPKVQWLRNSKVLGENDQDVDYADLILDVEKSNTGLYSCVVANIAGNGERTIRLEVLEPPKIIQSIFQTSSTLEVISGQAYYLHCHPIGNPLPEIYWFKDGLPLKLFDDSMLSMDYGETVAVKSASVEQNGIYMCVAKNSVGNDSVSYNVNVLVPPTKPKESSKIVNVRSSKALSLTCPVDGAPTPSIMWIKHPYTEIEHNNRIVFTDDNVTLFIKHTQVSDSGNYSCIMMNKAGTTEAIFSVTILKPPSIAGNVSLEEHIVPLWRSVVLKCEADGHPLPSINWLKDTQKLSTTSNVHRVLGNSLVALWRVTSRDAGQYICVVENEAGTAHRRYNVAVSVPGKWSVWSEWSLCNATCGIGQQLRTRACQYIDEQDNIIDKTTKPEKIVVDESACKGSSHERRKCQMPPCEEEGSGVWLSWSRWQPCSATCGEGTQARTRRCQDKMCEGDNVQIRKCPDLPKCSSTDDSENDVYSREGSKENAYIPEAVYEKEPEIVNSLYSSDVEEFYNVGGSNPSQVVYDVNVTRNLDGSDPGPCTPGFRPSEDGACEDIDECELVNNHCHSTQMCVNSAGGYTCSCTHGYHSLGVGQRCMDINECSLDSSGCEFACVNTAGGYICACPSHLRLHADKHHCYAVSSTYRMSYEALDTSELLSTSIEHPARYKHIRNA